MCGVTSTVEVFEPPHVDRGWPNERVLKIKLAEDHKRGNTDVCAMLSTSTMNTQVCAALS